jgi:hypothetical protein
VPARPDRRDRARRQVRARRDLTRRARVALVAGGYALALVAGAAAGWLYDVWAAAQPYDTSGGMYAGGQLLTALGAFGIAALPPTLLLLWFLRASPIAWLVIASGSLGFAVVGLAAVLAQAALRGRADTVPAMLIDLLGLAQLLGVPLFTAAFALFALLAPTRSARQLLVAAVGVELLVAVCAAVHWFLLVPPL